VATRASATDALPAPLAKIVQAFQMVPDPMARYKQLLFYATRLKPLAKDLQVEENKVQGCVSQVWVVATLGEGDVVTFEAESDSQLTKGLAALLVEGLSGCTVQEVVRVQPEFVEQLGLKQSLTPSRNNGFLNMLKKMQQQALAVYAEAQAGVGASGEGESSGGGVEAEAEEEFDEGAPVASAMRRKLRAALEPVAALEIEDQSHQHAGHGGSKGLRSTETHFAVAVVSPKFEGVPAVRRHQMVYKALAQELKEGVHALSLSTKTPAEADAK